MTPEEKSLLERTYKMVEENNSILRSIRRSNRFSNAMKIAYWVVILGLGFGAYYFIQPYMESMLGIIGKADTVLNDANGTVSAAQSRLDELTNLLK